MAPLYLLLVIGGLAVGYLERDSEYVVAVAVGIAALAAQPLASSFVDFERGFILPTLLTSTIMRRRTIRVSLAYLISIPVDGEQLLVRGERITTQFQPVGGVFKVRPESSILTDVAARPDTRFKRDPVSDNDLRVLLPGRNVHRLLRWFNSREEREIFPWREFYEELIRPGYLDAQVFAYFDCSFRATRHRPFRFDKYSQHWQLIIAEVYEMHPNDEQRRHLKELRDKVKRGEVDGVVFATPEEIARGGARDSEEAHFDIPPTAAWLIGQ